MTSSTKFARRRCRTVDDVRRPTRQNNAVSASRSNDRGDRGFTLLELILALSLSVLIMMAIGMAIQVHLRSFDSRQNVLNESQLARAILRIIADDIRSVVVHYEQDVSSIEAMLANVSVTGGGAEAGDGGGGSTSGNEGGEQGGDSGSGAASAGSSQGTGSETSGELTTTTASTDLSTTLTLPTKPGIYGNQYQLQVDISRLPRLDEYQPDVTANPSSEILDIPSDVKTVSYFMTEVDAASAQALNPLAAPTAGVQQGLIRRQLDRALTRWAMQNAAATSLMQSGDLLATEVVGLEFQYFDGLEWRTDWDTEYNQGLPLAIQVVLYMAGGEGESEELTSIDAISGGQTSAQYYRLVVDIPSGAAQITESASSSDTGSEEL